MTTSRSRSPPASAPRNGAGRCTSTILNLEISTTGDDLLATTRCLSGEIALPAKGFSNDSIVQSLAEHIGHQFERRVEFFDKDSTLVPENRLLREYLGMITAKVTDTIDLVVGNPGGSDITLKSVEAEESVEDLRTRLQGRFDISGPWRLRFGDLRLNDAELVKDFNFKHRAVLHVYQDGNPSPTRLAKAVTKVATLFFLHSGGAFGSGYQGATQHLPHGPKY